MSENQLNKDKKLWKHIKTQKNSRQELQSETAERFSMPDPAKKQSQISKGRGFYSDAFARQDHQLKNQQNQYSSPYEQSSQPELQQEAEQIDIEKALQVNFDEGADQLFGKQVDLNLDEIPREEEFLMQIEDKDKKELNLLRNDQFQQEDAGNQQDNDIKYLAQINQQPMIRSLSENCNQTKDTKKVVRQKWQRVWEKVKSLNHEMRGVSISIEQSKCLWKSWVAKEMHDKLNSFLQSSISKTVNLENLQIIKEQINEVQKVNKAKVSVLEERILEKISIINVLQLENLNQKQRIKHLEKELEEAKDENLKLIEQIFDGQQRIAQIDLEVDEKVKQILAKEGMENRGQSSQKESKDKERYLKQIKQLQENLQILSQKYQIKSENQASELQKISIFEQELNERAYALKMQEEKIQNHYIEIQNQKNQLNLYSEQLNLREEELKISEKNLFKKLGQLEEKEARLMRISQTTQVYRRPTETDYEFPEKSPQIPATKNFYARKDTKQPKYEKNYRNPTVMSTNQQGPEFDAYSQKSKSKSRDTKNALKARTKYGTGQPSKMSIRQKIGQSGASAYGRSRVSSSNNQNNNRLNDLGSKLERLRQEIKKEIYEAR